MGFTLKVPDPQAPRRTKYEALLPQIKYLFAHNQAPTTAQLANLISALHTSFEFLWTGIYLVHTNTQLTLGPFQGPVACMTIPYGKGVCGTAWKQNQSLIIPDVHNFKGHIACSSEAASEIVIPLMIKKNIYGILDIDSPNKAFFSPMDYEYLSLLLAYLKPAFDTAPLAPPT